MFYNDLASNMTKASIPASIWSGFHQKTVLDRIALLKKIYPSLDEEALTKGKLEMSTADLMIENCIGILPLPIGLGLNFVINGKKRIIPMAIEEPSVIAAASSSAKFICERGDGFKVYTTDPIMPAQIQVIGVDYESAKYKLDEHKQDIISFANMHCKSMVKRGGGCKGVRHRKLYEIDTESEAKDVIVVELLINVQESMGMNI